MVKGSVYSCVIVGSTWALTAAHVAHDPSNTSVVLNLDGDLTHRLAVKVAHPCPPIPLPEGPAYQADLALLELAQAVPSSMPMAALSHTPAKRGLRVELAGYGASGTGNEAPDSGANAALRRRGANVLEALVTVPADHGLPVRYMFVFDPPTLRMGRLVRRTASLGNRIETGLASGDSGGGAFVMEDARPTLLGINTFVGRINPSRPVSYGFGTPGGGELLAPHRNWLHRMLADGR